MRLLSVLLVVLGTILPLQAQRDTDAAITDLLAKGDAAGLSVHFNEHVEIVLNTTNDVYSRNQASGILADFFKKNKVVAYQVLHKGSKENSAFTIGSLRTATGNFRVYILIRRTTGERPLIQQLRIESSND